jgi:hypothetical protein
VSNGEPKPVEPHPAFWPAYGTAFALERAQRVALGRALNEQLLRECAHEALTAARGAVIGAQMIDAIGEQVFG